jgi:hypothetical protein
MRKIGYSVLLALLFVVILAFTVYSQPAAPAAEEPAVQVLQGGLSQQVPIAVTLVITSDSGPQTVTVPLMLNLNLSIGPVNALTMDVQAEQPLQVVSPLQVVAPLTEAAPVTATGAVTSGEAVTE